jgi:uncharacterized protein (TIGR03067 family)
MKWQALVVVAALASVAADPPTDEAARKDLQRLKGTWQVQTMTLGGRPAPANETANKKLTFDGSKLTLHDADHQEEAEVILDAGKKPPTITIDPKNGKEKPAEGIYQLEGDSLKMCFNPPGQGRPKEFASPEGSQTALVVLKRVKK